MDGINLKNVPTQADNPKASFDLSFKRFFDYKFGDLIPVMMLPVLPKDDISVSYEFLQRMAPFISQVFQDYKVCFDFYFVSNHLVYNNFELFMSAGWDGKQSYVHPYIDPDWIVSKALNNNFQHTLFDYLDINPNMFFADHRVLQNETLNAIPFAAYFQCVIDHCIGTDTALNALKERIMSKEYILKDGDNTETLTQNFAQLNFYNPNLVLPSSGTYGINFMYSPFKRLYPLDYFTSARANAQLGPVMTIPLQLVDESNGVQLLKFTNGVTATSSGTTPLIVKFTQGQNSLQVQNQSGNNLITVNGTVLNNVATINDFYSAAKIQELLTLYNFSGFTPGDRLAAEYGVKNPDSRMHRSEWLHSSMHDISIGEVFSNNVNNGTAQSGPMDIPGSGTAISSGGGSDRGFRAHFTQHGYLVGLMSCYPEASYFQGIPRHFSIKDRFDYPHFLLSEIGMASIKNKEIFAEQANQDNWNDDFAYMSQYGDSKVGINRVNGSLRNNLQYMNAGRFFHNESSDYVPQFNESFLHVNPAENSLNRTFNVVSSYFHDCPLLSKIDFRIDCKRQLPYYGLPRF